MALRNSIKEFKAYLADNESVLDTNYKRISEMIELHWGYKEFYIYMNKLLIAEKDRNRQGFPLLALQEISILQEIHEKTFPNLKTLINHNLANISRNKKNSDSILL